MERKWDMVEVGNWHSIEPCLNDVTSGSKSSLLSKRRAQLIPPSFSSSSKSMASTFTVRSAAWSEEAAKRSSELEVRLAKLRSFSMMLLQDFHVCSALRRRCDLAERRLLTTSRMCAAI